MLCINWECRKRFLKLGAPYDMENLYKIVAVDVKSSSCSFEALNIFYKIEKEGKMKSKGCKNWKEYLTERCWGLCRTTHVNGG